MTLRALRGFREVFAGAAVLLFTGCATTLDGAGDPYDPWESGNRAIYGFNDAIDRAVVEPVADLYLMLPDGLRDSIHNFFDNAAYPGTAINQLLQGKLDLALQDSARFMFNSTLGIAGLFDVSTGFGLERHEEDFGQTLAVWGVGEGSYIHYPLLGSSSTRDTPGIVVGALTDALTYFAALPLALLKVVDTRASLAAAVKIRDASALDPYEFTRDAYRQRRNFLIHDSKPPFDRFDGFDDEEEWDA